MAGRSDDGQSPCELMDNTTTSRLSYISMDMELKARNELLQLDTDMHNANGLHMEMLGRLEQLGDKLKKSREAAEKILQAMMNTDNEIEESNDKMDEMLADRRKLEKQSTYYGFCNHLLNSDPENSGLWYFTGTQCPVCLEKYKDMAQLSHCQHLLCVSCLSSMFETVQSCPLCTSEIIGYDIFDRKLLRTEYVTATQHQERISKVDVDTRRVSDRLESVPRPSAVGDTPAAGIRLRNSLYYFPNILEEV